jgi:hypothetical protein
MRHGTIVASYDHPDEYISNASDSEYNRYLEFLNSLTIDNFPETWHPVNKKNSEQSFAADIIASTYVAALCKQTKDFYASIANGASNRSQQTRRATTNLEKGNRELFKIIFSDLYEQESVDLKGFYTE